MKLTTRNIVILTVCLVLSVSVLLSFYYSETPWIIKPRSWYHDDLYTRGLIHYQSMDGGMKSCWNNTGKKYLDIVCPVMDANSEIEVELAFFLTSCFCESVGNPPLYCDFKGNAGYGKTLSKCAKGKCHNQHGHDAFHTVYTRMYDLCHYYLQEIKQLKPTITQFHLNSLLYEARGAQSGRPVLKHLEKLILNEMEKRKIEYKSSLVSYLDDIRMILEDVGYSWGLISYEFKR